VCPSQMVRRKAEESPVVSDDVKPGDKGNVAECRTALSQAMMQPGEDEIQSLLPQLSSKNDNTDTNQLDSSCNFVLKQRRETVCNLPVSVRDVNSCVSKVADGTAKKCENIVHKRGNKVETKTKLMQQHLSTRMHRSLELDVLLTPLSERRLKSYIRPHHPVANNRLSPLLVDSTASTQEVPEISEPCASVPTCIYKNDELLTGGVEADVIESTVPKSTEVSRTCSVMPLQLLPVNDALVNEDAEIDVFARSFWDDGSGHGSHDDFNPVVDSGNQQVSDNCRVGSRLKKKSKRASSKQKRIPGKRKVTETTKISRSKQQLRNIAPHVMNKNSKKQQSKAESNCDKSSGKNQKGAKSNGNGILRSFAMNLRPRKKAEVDVVREKASFSCSKRKRIHSDVSTKPASKQRKLSGKATVKESVKPDKQTAVRRGSTLRTVCPAVDKAVTCRVESKQSKTTCNTCQQTKTSAHTRKQKSQSSNVQRKAKSKQPSQNSCTKEVPVAASSRTARKRGHKSRSPPLLLSVASDYKDMLCSQTRRKCKPNQKCRQASRKRIHSDVSTKPASKQRKLSSKATVKESVKPKQQTAVRRGSTPRTVCPTVDKAVTCRVESKQSKTTHNTCSKKSHSAKQLASKRVTGKQETKVRKVTSAQLTVHSENIKVTAPKREQSCKTTCVGDTGSSLSIKGKKTRSRDFSLLYIILLT